MSICYEQKYIVVYNNNYVWISNDSKQCFKMVKRNVYISNVIGYFFHISIHKVLSTVSVSTMKQPRRNIPLTNVLPFLFL